MLQTNGLSTASLTTSGMARLLSTPSDGCGLPASPLGWRYRQDFKVAPESALPDHPQPAQRPHVLLLGDDALIRVQVVNRLRVMAYRGPMSAIRP